MEILLTTLHVLTCLALILIVLLQHGKGADIGVQFGASQTVFGARGAGNFLTKLTTGAAIVFMSTSFVLSKLSGRSEVSDILADSPAEQAPAPTEPPAPTSEVQPTPIEGDEPVGGESGVPGFEQIPPPAPAPPAEPAPPPSVPPPAPAR